MADLAIESIDGGQRFTVRQGKWTPLKVAAIPFVVSLVLTGIGAWLVNTGAWLTGFLIGVAGGLCFLLALVFGAIMLALSLSVRETVVFAVAPDAITVDGRTIPVADITSIHHGSPRSSSGVEIGLAGDLAGLMGLALASRSAAVWLRVGDRAIYLARQTRKAEAAEIFNAIKSIVRLN